MQVNMNTFSGSVCRCEPMFSHNGRVAVDDIDLRTLITARSTLLFDGVTNEPFLQLNPPLAEFRVTPPRTADAKHYKEGLESPSVSSWILGPPNPIPMTWAIDKMEEDVQRCQGLFASWSDRPLGGFPLRTIREVRETGEERYVGDLFMRPCLATERPEGETWTVGVSSSSPRSR